LEHGDARGAVEAERALDERALGASEHAGAIEGARGLVAGVEPLDHDRAIEDRVDGARELGDRGAPERRLELITRPGLALLGERGDRVRAGGGFGARPQARPAAEVDGLELVPEIAERGGALARVLDQ